MSFKKILLVDSRGNATPINHFELQSKGLNYWKGWRCFVGESTLNIHPTGEMWLGVCGVGGIIGNALETPFPGLPLRNDPLICEREQCGCAFDFYTPRYCRPGDGRLTENFQVNDAADLSDIVAVVPKYPPREFCVSWNLGMRCNYDCWYCGSHDSKSKFWTIEQIRPVVDGIHQHIQGRFDRIRFSIVGGEPSLNPDLLAFSSYAVGLGHKVCVDSNMSRSAKYYIELLRIVGSVQFSIHLDYVTPDVAFSKIQAIVEWICEYQPQWDSQIVLKYMLQPGRLGELREFIRQLCRIPNFDRYVWSEVAPLVFQEGGHSRALRDYTSEEAEFLRNPKLVFDTAPTVAAPVMQQNAET